MTESVVQENRKPGIVIFAAVLNLIGVGIIALLMLICVGIIVLGKTALLARNLSDQMPRLSAYGDAGVMVVMTVVIIFLSLLLAFSLYTGIGLLRAKKLAWYFQVIISVTGLLAFPIGTVLHAIVLFFFFKSRIRDHFKV